MKKNLLLAILCITVFSAFGQKLPFQGKLLLDGVAVDSTLSFEFSIPAHIWSETHAEVTVTDGLYFVVLGSLTPLPDSLFYGVDEQNLAISVDGTPLSPVILFKPLTPTFEGSTLSVKNSEGTVVGELKAIEDSVAKNGELVVYGPNGIKNASLSSHPDNVNHGEIETYDENGEVLSRISSYNGTGGLKVFGDSLSSAQLSFKAGNADGRKKPRLLLKSEGKQMATVEVASKDGIETGMVEVRGPNSKNVFMGAHAWNNSDLPLLLLKGTSSQDVIRLGAENDSLESGNIHIFSKNGNSIYMNANHANFHTTNDKELHLESQRVSLRHFVESEWNEVLILSSQLNEETNTGWNGKVDVRGPASTNVNIGSRDWENANLPVINLFGTNDGTNDFHAMELTVLEDSTEGEFGEISLFSENGKSAYLNPTHISFNQGDTATMAYSVDGVSGSGPLNLYNGAVVHGDITLAGPTSNNVHIGSTGHNANLPWMVLRGNRTDLIHLSGADNDANELGYISVLSEDGNENHVNGYGMYITTNGTQSSSFDSNSASFRDNGDTLNYTAYGISGSTPLEISNGATVHGDFDVNGHITAISVTETSDKRFKKNIQTIGITLPKVKLIGGVSYNWRQDEFPDKNFSSDKQIGVIAQELEAQYPALVKTDKEGYKSVNYNGFTAVLLEAVKELNAKVEKLETENIQLKAELSAAATNTSEIGQLKEQLETLTKMVLAGQQNEVANIEASTSTPDFK